MNKKTTDIVGYITPIGFIIALIFGTRQESRFHLNQALVLLIAEVVVEILDKFLERIPLVDIVAAIVLGAAALALFIIWITALVGAIKGEEKPMPILGGVSLLK